MCAHAGALAPNKSSAAAGRQRHGADQIETLLFFVIKAVANRASPIDYCTRLSSSSHHRGPHIHWLSHEPHGAEQEQ